MMYSRSVEFSLCKVTARMLVGIAIVSITQLDAPGSRAESLKLGVPSMDATP